MNLELNDPLGQLLYDSGVSLLAGIAGGFIVVNRAESEGYLVGAMVAAVVVLIG